jgi:hypothetical protein
VCPWDKAVKQSPAIAVHECARHAVSVQVPSKQPPLHPQDLDNHLALTMFDLKNVLAVLQSHGSRVKNVRPHFWGHPVKHS